MRLLDQLEVVHFKCFHWPRETSKEESEQVWLGGRPVVNVKTKGTDRIQGDRKILNKSLPH